MTIVKFKTIFKQSSSFTLNKKTKAIIKDLISWSKICTSQICPTLKESGNISLHIKKNFLITKSGALLDKLSEKDLIPVINCNLKKQEATVIGNKYPSSETMLHAFIYSKLPEVKVIFHFHDDEVLKKAARLNLPITRKEAPFGSLKLVEEISRLLPVARNDKKNPAGNDKKTPAGNDKKNCKINKNYLVLKNHGIISFGKNPEKVVKLILKFHKKAKNLTAKS